MNIQTLLYEATYADEIKEITKDIFLLLSKENKKEGTLTIKEILNKNIKDINIIKNLQKIEDVRVKYKFGNKSGQNPGMFYSHKDFPTINLELKELASSSSYDIIAHEVTHLLDFIRRFPVEFELSVKQGKRYIKAADKSNSAKNFNRILSAHIKNGDMNNANKLYERMFKGTAPYFLSRVEFNEHITEFVIKYNQAFFTLL